MSKWNKSKIKEIYELFVAGGYDIYDISAIYNSKPYFIKQKIEERDWIVKTGLSDIYDGCKTDEPFFSLKKAGFKSDGDVIASISDKSINIKLPLGTNHDQAFATINEIRSYFLNKYNVQWDETLFEKSYIHLHGDPRPKPQSEIVLLENKTKKINAAISFLLKNNYRVIPPKTKKFNRQQQ